MADHCNVTHVGWPTPVVSAKDEAVRWLTEHKAGHSAGTTTLEACQAANIIRGLLAAADGVSETSAQAQQQGNGGVA